MSFPDRPSDYGATSARILRDEPTMRTAVTGAARSKDERRRAAWSQIDAEAWRDWARDLKSHVLTHLDRYLEEAEDRLIENGVHVHWAETAEQACAVVAAVARGQDVRRIVKAKSMLTEEIGLNAYLEAGGIEVRETDLGEYIIQLRKEPPSHIIAPAVHVNKEQVEADFRRVHTDLPADRPLPSGIVPPTVPRIAPETVQEIPTRSPRP